MIETMIPEDEASMDLAPDWGARTEFTICKRCNWRYLLLEGSLPQRCPHCFKEELIAYKVQPGAVIDQSIAELVLIHSMSADGLSARITEFASSIPFSPQDLVAAKLISRLQRIFIPVWLVDAEAQANWRAEVGFNYQVVSHQDRYDDHQRGWISQEVKENRIRWEPRLGRLRRSYPNVQAPGLEGVNNPVKKLGDFPISEAEPYQATILQNAFIRLPDRSKTDAWTDAAASLQILAAADCQRAAGADHIRQFQWHSQYSSVNWSLLLLPIYTTFYLDDDHQPRLISIHGMSGRVSGERLASMQRARRTSGIILAFAALLFIIGLALLAIGAIAPPVLAFGGLVILFSVLATLGCLVPLVVAWQFNRADHSS